MDGAIVRVTLSLIGPGIMLVFGLAFAGAWTLDRRRPYLLLLAAASLLFALGAVSQILYLPSTTGANAMVSGALYTGAVLLAAQGILLRSGREAPWVLCAALLFVIMTLLGYFFYVERSLLARVYIQNFGYGAILLAAALRLRALIGGRPVDRILFWALLAFALHFFPRTMLTIGISAPAGEHAFANSIFWQTLQLSIAVLGVGLTLAVFLAAVSDLIDDLRQERDIDALTGILNRRAFEEAVAVRLNEGIPASLVVFDIDYFKRINDRFGHGAGDSVLKDIGKILSQATRPQDVVGRFGGEEFYLFLTRTDLREARESAERLRITVEHFNFPIPQYGLPVTASLGVAELRPGESLDCLFKRADSCLYAAKKAGRNRTMTTADQHASNDRRTDPPTPGCI
jgi:diguanylate cyclase (GGDEF)-like protein